MEEAVAALTSSSLLKLSTVILGTMILKDIVSGIASGLIFAFNPYFNVGDKVIMNDKDGVIVSIGWRYTIIEVGDIWYYVFNDRLKMLQLGKRK